MTPELSGKFQDQTVVVTGAGSGIGRATALLFARQGARVVAADVDSASVQSCSDEIRHANGQAIPVCCDATVEDDVRALADHAVEIFGAVHFLVCSAGVMLLRGPDVASSADWARCFSVNVTGAALAARYCCAHMKQQEAGGAVVFVSSICGYRPDPGFATYSASKAALLMLTRSLALDYGRANIRVNAVAPGPVDTPGLRSIIERGNGDWAHWQQSVAGLQCIRSIVHAEDVASAILFLCSDQARMITGTSLAVDGGLLARSAVA